MRVSVIVSLIRDASACEALRSLSSEGDCPHLDLLFLLLPFSVRIKYWLLERRIAIKSDDGMK